MNNNAFEVLADGAEDGELVSIESFKFTGLVPDGKVSIQEENFSKTKYPSTVSLLACSGKFGYFVAGHVQGFVFGQTKALRSAFYTSGKGTIATLHDKTIIPLTPAVYQLRLSSDEQSILVALSDGNLLSFSVVDIMEKKENAAPKHSVKLEAPLIDLRPNTGSLPDSACVLLKGNVCRLINWKTGETIANIPGSDFSAICWSPKGKQVVCGRLDGTLEHYDLAGIKKDSLPSPESMQAGYDNENVNRAVQDVLWIENHQFLVLYSRPPEPESDEFINTAYIVDRKPKIGTGPKYTHLAEVTPIFSPEGRSNHFYMETIYGFGDRFPHVVVLANGATNEISVVGEDKEGNWATWDLPENGMASLPLSEETNFDTFPLGLALDFSADEKLPPYDASESDVGVEPFPVLFHLNDEGQLGSFHCYNEDFAISGTKFQGMKTATTPTADSVDTPASTAVAAETTTAAAPAPSPFATTSTAVTPSPFSASSFSSGPFGAALNAGSSGSSFASLTKVQGATTPSFHGVSGGSGGFGSLAKNTVANAVTPTFGSTTSFGAASSSPAPAFGSTTSFGSSPAPAFGSTTSFGSSPAPAFGSTTSFGSSPAFGSLQKKEGTPAFTPSSTSDFGSSGFASLEKKDGAPAFASSSFASLEKKDTPTNPSLPFGSTSFGAASGFGSARGLSDSPASSSSFEHVTKEEATDAPEKEESKTDVPSFGALALDDQGKSVTTKGTAEEKVDIGDAQEKKVVDQDETDNAKPEEEKEATALPKTDKTPAVAENKQGSDTETTLLNSGCLAAGKATSMTTTSTTTVPPKTTASLFGSTSGFGTTAPAAPAASTPATFTGFGTASPPSTGFKGFGSAAPPSTQPSPFGGFGATTPSSTPATTGGFGALAKNTVPGATAPTFGSTSNLGFGALAKNTVPGATNPTFGSSTTLGGASNKSGGFGSTSFGSKAATTTTTTSTTATPVQFSTPTAKLPETAETSLANKAVPSLPVQSSTTTVKLPETTTPSPATTLKEPIPKAQETKPAPAATPPSGPKPEAKEGMAKEFEALYFKISAELEKLSTLQAGFGTQLQDQGKQLTSVAKSVQHLTENVEKWRLGEAGSIAETIGHQLNTNNIEDQQKRVEKLSAKTMELAAKEEQIKQCLDTEQDSDLADRLAERALDDTTREECEALELRSRRTGDLLDELEYRMINKVQQQRKPIQTDTSNFSFYDFHCAIRDVERDLKRKDTEVKDLERQLTLLRFREQQRRAQYSPSTITFEDLTDDDDDDDTGLDGQFSQDHIDYTVKYIQEEQTLDKLCALTSQHSPFTVSGSQKH